MTLPVEITVHRPILMLVGVTSLPDCDGTERVGCKSPRNCTSAMMTVRPPRVMFAVPVMAERRETLLPESCSHIRPLSLEGLYPSRYSKFNVTMGLGL
jgi:hypothetical protein